MKWINEGSSSVSFWQVPGAWTSNCVEKTGQACVDMLYPQPQWFMITYRETLGRDSDFSMSSAKILEAVGYLKDYPQVIIDLDSRNCPLGAVDDSLRGVSSYCMENWIPFTYFYENKAHKYQKIIPNASVFNTIDFNTDFSYFWEKFFVLDQDITPERINEFMKWTELSDNKCELFVLCDDKSVDWYTTISDYIYIKNDPDFTNTWEAVHTKVLEAKRDFHGLTRNEYWYFYIDRNSNQSKRYAVIEEWALFLWLRDDHPEKATDFHLQSLDVPSTPENVALLVSSLAILPLPRMQDARELVKILWISMNDLIEATSQNLVSTGMYTSVHTEYLDALLSGFAKLDSAIQEKVINYARDFSGTFFWIESLARISVYSDRTILKAEFQVLVNNVVVYLQEHDTENKICKDLKWQIYRVMWNRCTKRMLEDQIVQILFNATRI